METGYARLLVVDDSRPFKTGGVLRNGDIVWTDGHDDTGDFFNIFIMEDGELVGHGNYYTSRFKILTNESKSATIEIKEKNEMKNTYVTLGDNTRAIVPQEPVIEHYSTTKGEWVALEDMATEHIMNATRRILNSGKAQVVVDNSDLHYLVMELANRFAEMQSEE